MSQPDRTKLPIASRHSRRRQQDARRSEPDWDLIGHVEAPDGAPNVLMVLIDEPVSVTPGRSGDRSTRRTTPGCARGPSLQPLPRHRPVFADACCAAHRSQQPCGRLRFGRGVLDRFPRIHGVRPRRLRPLPEDPPGQRLQHLRIRQVASHAGWPAGSRRSVQPLAHGLGVRLLLRIPRRRVGAVGPVPGPRTRRSSALPDTFPDDVDDPYYLPDDMADKTIDWLHSIRGQDVDQAVLRLLLHRMQSRSPSRFRGVGGEVQGQVRSGLGQASRGDFRRQKERGVDPSRGRS